MSQCSLIKNGLVYYPEKGSTYCCETEPYDAQRELFIFEKWDEKRAHEIDKYNQSKSIWLPECDSCRHHEKVMGHSVRTEDNETWSHVSDDDNNIKTAIIKTSNLCNLACRMCSPNVSTKWQQVVANNPINGFYKDEMKELQQTTIDDMTYMKDLVLTEHLEHISFSGGEPMLSKWNVEILQYLIDKDLCKNIAFGIITNGTVKFTDAWLESIIQFKHASVAFSMDGLGSVIEYIRPGLKWQTMVGVIDHLHTTLPDLPITFSYVAQALNAHTFWDDQTRMEKWQLDLESETGSFLDNVSICRFPQHLSYRVLAPALRDKYKMTEYTEDLPYEERQYKVFMRQMAWQDNAHNTSLKDHNPDFFDIEFYPQEMINEYYNRRIMVRND